MKLSLQSSQEGGYSEGRTARRPDHPPRFKHTRFPVTDAGACQQNAIRGAQP
jgi:hypothetical protein